MNATQTLQRIRAAHPIFFCRETMQFWGDTLRNFGVRTVLATTWTGGNKEVIEVYRRRPVKYGLQASHYFDPQTLRIIYLPEQDERKTS